MSGGEPIGPTVYTVAKWLTYVFSNKVCILIEVNVMQLSACLI